MKGNKDAVSRQIASTGGQLEELEKVLGGWKQDNKEGTPWMNHFKAYVFHIANESKRMTIQLFSTLEEELRKLNKLNDESNFKKFLDHENEQGQIGDIFVRINEARVQFEVRTMTFCSSVFSQCHFYVARVGCKSFCGGVRSGQSRQGT